MLAEAPLLRFGRPGPLSVAGRAVQNRLVVVITKGVEERQGFDVTTRMGDAEHTALYTPGLGLG